MKSSILIVALSLFLTTGSIAFAAKKAATPATADTSADMNTNSKSNDDASPSPTPDVYAPIVNQADTSSQDAPKEMKVFAGVDIGHSALAKVPGGEQNKSGYLFDIKATGSYYLPKWDFDLGVGYFSGNLSTNVKNLRIVTNGFLLTVDPQYRILPQWQFGPVFDALMGSDVSFSEGVSNTSFKLLAGLGTKYDIQFGVYDMRLVVQGLTSVTNTDRLLWAIQGGVQFGFSVATH